MSWRCCGGGAHSQGIRAGWEIRDRGATGHERILRRRFRRLSGATARRRPRPNHSTAFRANVAFAALTSDATTAALASRCDVHAHQVTQSKPQLVAQASAVFSGDGVRTDAAPGVDVKALHAMIRQQALEIVSGSLGQPRGPTNRSGTLDLNTVEYCVIVPVPLRPHLEPAPHDLTRAVRRQLS